MKRKLPLVLCPLRHLGRNTMTMVVEMATSCCTLRLFLAKTLRLSLQRRTSRPCLTTERHWSMSSLRVHFPLFKLGSNTHRAPPLVHFPRKSRAGPLKTRGPPAPSHEKNPAAWLDTSKEKMVEGGKLVLDKVAEGTKSLKGNAGEGRKFVTMKTQYQARIRSRFHSKQPDLSPVCFDIHYAKLG
jgi:hypothetical protein